MVPNICTPVQLLSYDVSVLIVGVHEFIAFAVRLDDLHFHDIHYTDNSSFVKGSLGCFRGFFLEGASGYVAVVWITRYNSRRNYRNRICPPGIGLATFPPPLCFHYTISIGICQGVSALFPELFPTFF
jgi:hypothetical protein